MGGGETRWLGTASIVLSDERWRRGDGPSLPIPTSSGAGFRPHTGGDNGMGRIETYRAYVQELLERHAQRYPVCAGVEVQTLYDTERDHYQLLLVGWEELHRVYECV